MEKIIYLAICIAVGMTLAGHASAVGQVGKGLTADNATLAEILTGESFSLIFPHKDSVLSHASGFYEYDAFLKAAAIFADQGFALVGGSKVQIRELSAFLAHMTHETSCGWSGSVGGPYAWGLCYKEELSPASIYCEPDTLYPCVNGVSYHYRGAYPLTYNYNYGPIGNYFGVDMLGYPGIVANNATLAFATAIYYWMVKQDPNPSPHSVMVGEWKPTKFDTENFRTAGFGLTINIRNGQVECGHGDDIRADDRIGSYLRIAKILGAQDYDKNLDCGEQTMYPTGYTVVKKKKAA